jgi:hypothetical protein
MEPLLRRLTSHGLRRGLAGSSPWLVVGVLAIGMRALRRIAAPEPDILYRTAIRPGDMFEITTRRAPR